VKSRRIFSQIAVKKMGYSGADMARFLGIIMSAVNRLAISDEAPEVEKYFKSFWNQRPLFHRMRFLEV